MASIGFNLNQMSGLSYNQRLIERPELYFFSGIKKLISLKSRSLVFVPSLKSLFYQPNVLISTVYTADKCFLGNILINANGFQTANFLLKGIKCFSKLCERSSTVLNRLRGPLLGFPCGLSIYLMEKEHKS